MPGYAVNHRYGSKRDGQLFGPWEADTSVDLTEADAEWVNRDSPGTLTPLEPGVEADGEAPAAKDRQHRGGRKRS